MRHVAPHRWADAWAGKLPEREIAAMDRHAEACERCAKARDRITRVSSTTFPALRTQSAPEVKWDAVRARVYWSVSTEKHQKYSPPRTRQLAFAGVLAGTIAIAFATGPLHGAAPARAKEPIAIAPRAVAKPAALAGLVSRVSGDVMIDGLRTPDAFARTLAAGAVIATADGRLDVQFGDGSAFALGARSTLELRRFDAAAIELAVDGTVDVVVAPRAPGQTFRVVAGDETVEVRGTQFRVTRDARGVRVACRHGLVAVRDGSGELAIGAAREAFVQPAQAAAAHAQPLSADALGELAAATPVTLPLWNDSLATTSAPLEIATAARRDVRVDGVEVGAAPLRLRVMPGRHTVEAADRAGRYRRAGWVDVAAGKAGHVDVPVADEAAPVAGTAERKKQLHAGIDRARLRACTHDLSKAGISGAYVEIQLAVDSAGNINFMNALDSDLGSSGQSCVLDVLRAVHFGAGAAATWRERIEL